MSREIQDGRIVVECLLGSVPVVEIPVNYQNLLELPLLLQISCSYGDIVEIAEAEWPLVECVVPGRTDGAKCVFDAVFHYSVNPGQYGGCGKSAYYRAVCLHFDPVYVFPGMDQLDVFADFRMHLRFDGKERRVELGGFYFADYSFEPGGRFNIVGGQGPGIQAHYPQDRSLFHG